MLQDKHVFVAANSDIFSKTNDVHFLLSNVQIVFELSVEGLLISIPSYVKAKFNYQLILIKENW